MRQLIKNFIALFPGGNSILKYQFHIRERFRILRMGDVKDVFTHYYKMNEWGDKESVSGPGSTINYTKNIRKEIPIIISRLEIRTIFDAPCGDYNWFRLIPRNNSINYTGGDIVDPLVARNQEKYGDNNTRFIVINIIKERLPQADLWFCRDCFPHFSNRDIFLAINNFLRSDIRYILTSIYPKSNNNIDITTGSYRDLNLELPPFCFGKPLLYIDDWIEGHPVRSLALWERKELLKTLASNKIMKQTLKMDGSVNINE